MSTDVRRKHGRKHGGSKHNGHMGHSNGSHGPDPTKLRFHGILAEMEHLPAVSPSWVAQLPAWLRNPLQKARGFILMAIKKAGGTFTVREGIIYVLLTASIGFGVTNYWKRQEEHDEVIRLRTIVELQEKANADRDSKIDQAANWGQSAKSDIRYLQGKFDQFADTYTVQKAVKD